MDIMKDLDEIDPLFLSENYREGFHRLWKLWKMIPEPKDQTPNAYWMIETGILFALRYRDFDEAEKWVELAPVFKIKRHDLGEVEFLIGKVAFAKGEISRARENFLIANKKSEGRAFEGEDPKYKDLVM